MSRETPATSANSQVKVPSRNGAGRFSEPVFSGKTESYKLWYKKAINYLRNVFPEQYEVTLEEDAAKKKEEPYVTQNKYLFDTLLTLLDDKTGQMILDRAYNDGMKAFELMKDEFIGSEVVLLPNYNPSFRIAAIRINR